jgi:hypothetical protein
MIWVHSVPATAARQIDPLAVALQLWTAPDKNTEFPALAANVSEHHGRHHTETTRPAKATRRTAG